MMSTLFSALVAIIAIANGQFDDDCGTTTVTVNGEALMMQLERDSTNERVRITLTGPTDKWFGFIIGQGTMQNGYAITGDGSSTYSLKERRLLKSNGGSVLSSSGTPSATVNGNAVLVLERPYAAPDSDYYDFTNLMTCQVESVSIAAARGSNSLAYSQHSGSNRRGGQTYTSQCCTDAPSKTPSATPTSSPVTSQPTTSPVTKQPTEDTDEPTKSPVTSQPSASPTEATSEPTESPEEMMTSTEEPADDVVICGEAELIDDVLLTVYRDATNEMVKIQVQGPSTAWFGYGFGASGLMIGSYAVTVEGADSDSLEVVQRKLTTKASPTEPGTVLTGGTSSTTTADSVTVGTLMMAYDAVSDFDFTDFLTCQVDSIDLIAAIGSGTSMGYHAEREKEMTLTRLSTCTCEEDPDDMSSTPVSPDGNSAYNIFNGFYVVIGLVIGLLFV